MFSSLETSSCNCLEGTNLRVPFVFADCMFVTGDFKVSFGKVSLACGQGFISGILDLQCLTSCSFLQC